MLEIFVSNHKNLEVNAVISHKKLSCTIFDKKKWEETEWTKILRTDSDRNLEKIFVQCILITKSAKR